MKPQEQVKVVLSSTIIEFEKKKSEKTRKNATVKPVVEKKVVVENVYHETYY